MEWTWLRWDLKRHWVALLVFALLVGVSAGFVMATAAGALRAFSAPARLQAVTNPATLAVLPNQVHFDWNAVRKLPTVAAVSPFYVTQYVVDYHKGENIVEGLDAAGWFPGVGKNVYRSVEKPVVLAGRMLNPGKADEVDVSPDFLNANHKKLGDTVRIGMWNPTTLPKIFTGQASVGPNGAEVTAKIVGVVRSTWYSDYGGSDGFVLPSPALTAKFHDDLVGNPPVAYLNALVRLRHGAADVPAFTRSFDALIGRTNVEFFNLPQMLAAIQSGIDFEAWSLLALSGAALIAGGFLAGQAIARSAAGASSELAPLRAIGLTSRRSVVASVLPLALATAAGCLAGAAIAVAASPIFPIGTAGEVEPTPGLSIDSRVLAGVGLVVFLGLTAIACLSSWVATRHVAGRQHVSAIATSAAAAGLPVSITMGTRFALEPGRGAQSAPVRPALIGAIAGVAGVVGALTFAFGIAGVQTHPAQYGTVYQLQADIGEASHDFLDPGKVLPKLAKDPMVGAMNSSVDSVGQIGGSKVTLITFDPVKRAVPFTVTEGHLPRAADQIVLGPSTAKLLNVGVGHNIHIVGSGGRSMNDRIVGLAFAPVTAHSDYDNAAMITPAAHLALFGSAFVEHDLEVTLAPGVKAAAAAAHLDRLAVALGAPGLQLTMPMTPAQVAQLGEIGALPEVLGAFLAVVAVASLGHALVVAIRRRRKDIAVLRALGQTPGQARTISVTQATIVGAIGLIIGIPLGIALGRTVWRFVANLTPVEYVDPLSLVLILTIIPAAVILVNLVAMWPGRQAARLNVSTVLRAE